MLPLLLLVLGASPQVELVTDQVPFPRGLAIVDGQLHVLSRGRVRDVGGVDPTIDDRAGTIWAIDHAGSATVVAEPTNPPFRLLDRTLTDAVLDRQTDRPYCTLRYHEPTRSFYLCAFSGIDRPISAQQNFAKNFTDAILRYDLRTRQWHEVERHDIDAQHVYPHHDVTQSPPPHGWLKGPDNCLPVAHWLYAVAKDNSLLVRYDLQRWADDPHAPPPPGEWVLGEQIAIAGQGTQRFQGHSMLAVHDGWMYLGFRTSSEIIRFRLGADGSPLQPIQAQIVARFEPWNPATRRSANLTDMAFDAQGRLYVMSAQPARIHRFTPSPDTVYDARHDAQQPWADMSQLLNARGLKGENVLVDDQGRVYVTIADTYGDSGAQSAVYRVRER